jgi:histone H3/H4
MLYSAEALDEVDAIMWEMSRRLKAMALALASQEGRELITEDDVRQVFVNFDNDDIKDILVSC